MANIQVGSTITTYGKNGEIVEQESRPSYLIHDDGTKTELTEEQAKAFGIGADR